MAAPVVHAPAPAWLAQYQRRCNGSITPPVVSLAWDEVVVCDARFSLARGRFEGHAPLGVLAFVDDRFVTDDYGSGGLSLRDLDGAAVQQHGGGRPERVAVSPNGAWLAAVETVEPTKAAAATARVHRVGLWTLPDLDRVHAVEIRSDELLTLAVDDHGTARWYEASSGGAALAADGTRPAWEAPEGLAGLAIDPAGAWMVAIDQSGHRWIQPTSNRTPRIEIPGISKAPQWPSYRLAITPAAATVAFADADDVELWARDGEALSQLASFPITEVDALVLDPAGGTLLVAQHDDLHVFRPGAPQTTTAPPRVELPLLPTWEHFPVRDGTPQPLSSRGTLLPDEPGATAWAYEKEGAAEVRVLVADRAQFDYPDLSTEAWARRVIERLDPGLPWERGRIALPHTLHTWVDDGERRLELHYTTVDGCEHYEIVRRVAEQGEWVVRHDLQTFEGAPWREAWTHMVAAPPIP